MGIRSCLWEATFTMFGGGHSFLLCAIAFTSFGLVGICLLFDVLCGCWASNLKCEMTNMKPWEVGGDPWRPKHGFPENFGDPFRETTDISALVSGAQFKIKKPRPYLKWEWINYVL